MVDSRRIGVAVLATAIAGAAAMHVAHAQNASARGVVESAAKALGGIDKIRAVRNITLHGYGQYAYQMGRGRVSGSPNEPEKYLATNELKRVYDLEHDRFEMRERRNMLFPFLAPFGHSFARNVNVLDGDIAFDVKGRLHRLHPKKAEVRIVDYVDREVPMLMRMFAKRLRAYRAIGYARDEAPLGWRARSGTHS